MDDQTGSFPSPNAKPSGSEETEAAGRDLEIQGSEENGKPSKTLFVRNLSYSTHPSSLQAVFKDATDVFLPRDRETGEMRGFGFITFESVLAAENALKSLDGVTVDGREVTLRFAEERGERGARGPGRGRGFERDGDGGYGRGGGGGYGRGGSYGRGRGGGGYGRDGGSGYREGRGRTERSGRGGRGQQFD